MKRMCETLRDFLVEGDRIVRCRKTVCSWIVLPPRSVFLHLKILPPLPEQSLGRRQHQSLYKIEAFYVDPRELPDLAGLNRREAISIRWESFIPAYAFRPKMDTIPETRHKMAAIPDPRRKMAAISDPLL
ncbi:hypothetical protein DPX16_3477 [Anabarilius grahami]|uniref:Uncharacterized protein n=1 Tax=Anabarilius grahami TaxID=495550 RepID=A0A3N0XKR1_ANAGA|nr:hypothetical protein DPX16_3477 [Anabarilius grahami]